MHLMHARSFYFFYLDDTYSNDISVSNVKVNSSIHAGDDVIVGSFECIFVIKLSVSLYKAHVVMLWPTVCLSLIKNIQLQLYNIRKKVAP